MSDTTVSKYKLFWADQDLEQEQWLREMARQGLHLAGVQTIRWSFVKGEPADVVYRVDFSNAKRDSDYNRLLEDAGWECAATDAGWHYWRKAAVAGSVQEIFTDKESKIARFRQVLAIIIALNISTTVLFINASPTLSTRSLVMLGCIVAFFLYGAIRLLLRIGRLHRAA